MFFSNGKGRENHVERERERESAVVSWERGEKGELYLEREERGERK